MSEGTTPKEKVQALIQKVKDLPYRMKIIAGASLGVLLLVSIFLISSLIALNNWNKEADRLIKNEIHKISNDLRCSMPEIYETVWAPWVLLRELTSALRINVIKSMF